MKDEYFNTEKIKEVSASFKTYEEMYDLIVFGDYSFLSRKLNTKEYPEIGWMIEYFTEREEYEKCSFLMKIKEKLEEVYN